MYRPTIDNDLIQDYTYRLFQQGHFIKVPVIFGDDTNEGTIFVPQNTSSLGEANTFLQAQFPNIRPKDFIKINDWYLRPNDTMTFPDSEPYWRPTSNAFGEMRYVCSGIATSSIYASAGVSSWNYHYDVRELTEEASGFGVPHTVELSAIWGPQYVPGPASYTTTNAAIVPVMQGYWPSFIKHLDPNPGRYRGSPEWKQWGIENDYHRIYIRTNQTRMEHVPAEQIERCEYLVKIGAGLDP
jgi:carboxylesterase type B